MSKGSRNIVCVPKCDIEIVCLVFTYRYPSTHVTAQQRQQRRKGNET